MLPISLTHALNTFYKSQYPLIQPLSVPFSMEVEPGHRLPSVADAFLLLNHADEIGEEARNYVDFVATMAQKFRHVEAWYNTNVRISSEVEHEGAKDRPAGWAGFGSLPLALMFYCAVKDGTPGDYIECGVFKGGSLACMSHVCDYLGLSAIAADTFEGLPSDSETGYYRKGQFEGQLTEVQGYVAKCGKPDCVIWKQGLFSDTLSSLPNQVALAFVDTDLYESSVSALSALKMSPGSIIASDGVGWSDFLDGELQAWSEEGKAVQDCLSGAPFLGLWTGNGHMSLFKKRVSGDRLLYSTAFLHYITHRFFFPEEYSQLLVSLRRDAGRVLGRSNVTESDVLEFAFSEALEQLYRLSYMIGGLRWQISQLQV